ncbi:MAG: peptide deformylase [Bacteroides stercoris]
MKEANTDTREVPWTRTWWSMTRLSEGYLARVMQHEFDHLDGKMFIDHLSPLRRQMIKGKLNAMLKGKAHCTYKVKTVK